MNEAVLPKLLRMYEAIAATQSSFWVPIGTITCVYVVPFTGPVSPCRSVLIT